MKRLLFAWLFIMCMTGMASSEQCGRGTATAYSFITGNTAAQAINRPELEWAVAGELEGLVSGASFVNEECGKKLMLCTGRKPLTETVAVVRKYIIDNPAQRSLPLSLIVYNAVFAACMQTFNEMDSHLHR